MVRFFSANYKFGILTFLKDKRASAILIVAHIKTPFDRRFFSSSVTLSSFVSWLCSGVSPPVSRCTCPCLSTRSRAAFFSAHIPHPARELFLPSESVTGPLIRPVVWSIISYTSSSQVFSNHSFPDDPGYTATDTNQPALTPQLAKVSCFVT